MDSNPFQPVASLAPQGLNSTQKWYFCKTETKTLFDPVISDFWKRGNIYGL